MSEQQGVLVDFYVCPGCDMEFAKFLGKAEPLEHAKHCLDYMRWKVARVAGLLK